MNEIKQLVEKYNFTMAQLLELKELIEYKISVKDLEISSKFKK